MSSALLSKAIALAAKVHEGQIDRGGKAYILHPLRVMNGLSIYDQELMAIGVLHDVVEDSAVTFEDLENMGFTPRVVGALRLLTHIEGESYEDYIDRIATNEDAVKVKIEDLVDNSDLSRLKGVRPKDWERQAKYTNAYLRLTKNLGHGTTK